MLFSILKGNSSNISTSKTPFHEGWAYLTPDTGKFYIDAKVGSTERRILINPDAVSEESLTSVLASKADVSHTHDERYYTEDEVDSLLLYKAESSHTHDDRYYTEAEIDSKLSKKSDVDHTHADLVNGDASVALNAASSSEYNLSPSSVSTLIPEVSDDNTYDLGTSGAQWNNVYAKAVTLAGTDLKTSLDAMDTEIDGSIKSLSVSGRTITYTKNDGSTGTITTQDTDNCVTTSQANGAKAYITGTPSSGTQTSSLIYDSNVYLDTTAGQLVATTFKGNLSGNASSATTATSATSATKATQDASGNVIASTYETKTSAASKLDEAKTYTDEKVASLASTSTVDSKISAHNTSTSAHSDIRTLISDLTTKLNNFLDVDDTTTDQLSEVLTLINNNKGTLESLTTSKVNVSDIVNNLTTNSSSKVLSAAQGVIIKGLIDALQEELDSHTHTISDVTGLQSALDSKAASSHGTHVTYSTTTPVMDGTASAGTASTVARSDHKHPTDTSRASQSDFSSHTGDTTAHITSTERANWNAAKTHADSAHAPSTAEPNQNAFSNIAVGSTTVAADSATDTITFVGSNVTITPDATNDKITFAVATGSTSTKGIVQLVNSTSSTSTTTAATPSSVKSAYDLANTANSAAAAAQSTADGKADAFHTHSAATTSVAGFMSTTDKAKLDGISESADSVSFTRSLTGGTKVGTITINGTDTDLYAPTNTDTHYTSGTIVGGSTTATSNSTSSLGNGSVYLNHIEEGTVKNSHKISGSGATTVTSDTNGNIVISSTISKLAAYNLYQLMAASGTSVPGKRGIFFGDFSSAAAATASTGALRSSGGYYFGPSVGTQLTSSAEGDTYITVGIGTSDNPTYSFSITCPSWATITSISVDAGNISSSSSYALYLANFSIDGSTVSFGPNSSTCNLGTPSSTSRETLTKSFPSAILVSPGSVITGTIRTGNTSYTSRLYGYNGVPYIRLGCTGCTPSGWVTSGDQSLNGDEFSRAYAYVHLSTVTDCTVTASIGDSSGTEHEMTLIDTQVTVNPNGNSCTELCFQCPYTDSTANLKISVSVSGSGGVCLYSYGVTMM